MQDWVLAGLISDEQAVRIRAAEAARAGVSTLPVPPSAAGTGGTSLAVEALGYLGGVLILAATGLIAAQFWSDLSLAGQLALLALTAVVLLAAGTAVPRRLEASGHRLRSVLWVLSVTATAATLAVLAEDGLELSEEQVPFLAATGAAVYAVALWRVSRGSLLHATAFVALAVTVGTGTALLVVDELLVGLAVWAFSVAWLALGWADRITPRRTAYLLGSVGAVFAVQATMEEDWGLVLALVTVAALIGLAMLGQDLLLLAVGALGALLVLPRVVSEWFPGDLAAPLVLLVVGLLLVGAAIRISRRRARALPG